MKTGSDAGGALCTGRKAYFSHDSFAIAARAMILISKTWRLLIQRQKADFVLVTKDVEALKTEKTSRAAVDFIMT